MAVGFIDVFSLGDQYEIGLLMKDAKDFVAGSIPAARGAEWIHHYTRSETRSHLSNGIAKNSALKVYVNHGRWIAECPDCHGAQLACRSDHRFLCIDCGNIAVGNLWRAVHWPADPDGIEEALRHRPLENQNWDHPQTVEDLRAESIVHERM